MGTTLYSDPANRTTTFAQGVGGLLSGAGAADAFLRRQKAEAIAEEARKRGIDLETRNQDVKDWEAGLRVTPGTATAAAAPVSSTVSVGDSSPSLAAAVGARIGGGDGGALTPPDVSQTRTTPGAVTVTPQAATLPPGDKATQAPTAGATAAPGAAPTAAPTAPAQPGFLQRLGQRLATGGYEGYTPPHYAVTKVGPSAAEALEAQKGAEEFRREQERTRGAAAVEERRATQQDINDRRNRESAERIAQLRAETDRYVADSQADWHKELQRAQNDPHVKQRLTALHTLTEDLRARISEIDNTIKNTKPNPYDVDPKVRQQKLDAVADLERQKEGYVRQHDAASQELNTIQTTMSMGGDPRALIPEGGGGAAKKTPPPSPTPAPDFFRGGTAGFNMGATAPAGAPTAGATAPGPTTTRARVGGPIGGTAATAAPRLTRAQIEAGYQRALHDPKVPKPEADRLRAQLLQNALP